MSSKNYICKLPWHPPAYEISSHQVDGFVNRASHALRKPMRQVPRLLQQTLSPLARAIDNPMSHAKNPQGIERDRTPELLLLFRCLPHSVRESGEEEVIPSLMLVRGDGEMNRGRGARASLMDCSPWHVQQIARLQDDVEDWLADFLISHVPAVALGPTDLGCVQAPSLPTVQLEDKHVHVIMVGSETLRMRGSDVQAAPHKAMEHLLQLRTDSCYRRAQVLG
mmetsp:Transcript_10284/g.34287  ORF Transcript_10284/g.34287 Transcript_10284/m.34287 type:complete len:223 (-) Transcript_10284:572-1240(-)